MAPINIGVTGQAGKILEIFGLIIEFLYLSPAMGLH
jgi:hypothetical protein